MPGLHLIFNNVQIINILLSRISNMYGLLEKTNAKLLVNTIILLYKLILLFLSIFTSNQCPCLPAVFCSLGSFSDASDSHHLLPRFHFHKCTC